MRARPEQTQLEHLSDASFLAKVLVLPANVRLDWKVIARYKHSSLFDLVISNKEKSFIELTPAGQCNAAELAGPTVAERAGPML